MDEQQIRELIDRMNRAWLEGPIEEVAAVLDTCFHPAMVIRGGDLQINSAGKEECIQSYLDFLGSSAVQKCVLEDPAIDLAGDTAMAVYGWEMTYEQEGQTYAEAGSDILALARFDVGWLITWRAMLPSVQE